MRLKKWTRVSKGDKRMENMIKRPCTVFESLEQSLKEVKLMREGKIPKRSYWDVMKDFDKEDEE